MESSSNDVFKREIIDYLSQNLERIKISLGHLDESQIWWKPNENTNSIGNLLLHLEGNIRQYVLSGIKGEKDVRKRDNEFRDENIEIKKLFKGLSSTLEKSIKTIEKMSGESLHKEYKIQGFNLTGFNVLIHITEHFSYHTGQIALLTKMLVNKDLKFYGNFDLNQLNIDE